MARKYTIPLVILGVDSAKQYVMDRLSIEEKGPKYFHFPLDTADRKCGYDDIYFRGLISEQRVPHKKNGRIVWQWEIIAKDRRNEPLDLRGYNLACLQSLNPDFARIEAVISAKLDKNGNFLGEFLQRKQVKPAENASQKQFWWADRATR